MRGPGLNNKPLSERFESKYIPEPNSGCWIWTAYVNCDGYGRIAREGSRMGMELAHRVSWGLHRGSIPNGLQVLHRCDNPPCVNPDHLFLGDVSANMKDAVKKGRKIMPRGEKNYNATLTESQALEIKYSKVTNRKLAEKYGVTYGMIGHIKNGRAWKHLP